MLALLSRLLGRKVSKVLLSFLMSCYKLNDFEDLSDAILRNRLQDESSLCALKFTQKPAQHL